MTQPLNPSPQYSAESIALYEAFKRQLYNPASAVYPGCGYDASPSKVFSNVTFVDLDTAAMELFRRFGLKAITEDAKKYQPATPHDLMIMQNAGTPEWVGQRVRREGFVIANNYHKTATELHDLPQDFSLAATLGFADSSKGLAIVSRDLSGLFEPVASIEELKNLRPIDYDFLKKSVPHMLKTMSIQPGNTLDENYSIFKAAMGESTQLPAKRVAELYVFIKN